MRWMLLHKWEHGSLRCSALSGKLLVHGAVEIFSGLFVQIDILFGYGLPIHSNPLPGLILVGTGYPDVSVCLTHHLCSSICVVSIGNHLNPLLY